MTNPGGWLQCKSIVGVSFFGDVIFGAQLSNLAGSSVFLRAAFQSTRRVISDLGLWIYLILDNWVAETDQGVSKTGESD